MAPVALEDALARDRAVIERRLLALVTAHASEHPVIAEAIRYALIGGGKRVRPMLCMWTHDVFARTSTTRASAVDAACAVECVHAYSLVHDDLPCMDDDDLRRGRPSVHRQFDEATAVLTGDALLTLAFEIACRIDAPPACTLAIVREIATAAGSGGLITGQALDLAAESTDSPASRSIEDVDRIHEFKTARLIAASMVTGAIASQSCADDTIARVRRAGHLAGSAFQITDDLLDLSGDANVLGKTPGKDIAQRKLTYPAVAGVTAAERAGADRVASALAELPEAAESPLAALIESIVTRRA